MNASLSKPPFTQTYPQAQAVAASFSRSAKTYDEAAFLQRIVAQRLLASAKLQGHVLDLGCGTGTNTAVIASQTAVNTVTGVDIAPGMLALAKLQAPAVSNWLLADARQLPLADNSIDCVFSSLVLQWLGPTPAVFNELARVLVPGGRAYISTLLSGSLIELQQAWRAVDSNVHVNRFESHNAWCEGARAAGLAIARSHHYPSTRYFDSALHAMKELKALGARNLNTGKPQGLTGRRRLDAMAAAYEPWRVPQGLPVSYQVLQLEMIKPL